MRRVPVPRWRAWWPVRTHRWHTTLLALPVNLTAALTMATLWATVLFIYYCLGMVVVAILLIAEV